MFLRCASENKNPMSAKNKLQNKQLRKASRADEDLTWNRFSRVAVSQFPREAAVNVLANPKAKSTAPRRRRIRRALSFRLDVPRMAAIDPAVTLTRKLQRVTMTRLIRTIRHAARHAATFKYLAAKATPESGLQKNLIAAQTFQLSVLTQARAEYQVRTT